MNAMLQEARGKYVSRDYAAVVELLKDKPREELLDVPEEAFMLADAAHRVGGADNLLELINDTVKAARDQNLPQVLCDALNLQGAMLLDRGHTQAAERAWFDLVIVATQADNSQYVARASNNLGIAATLQMRLEQAIAGFQRAITAYLRIGYTRGLAQAHHNLAIVYRELDHDQKAHDHFHRAITFAKSADCVDDVARAEEELALLVLYSAGSTQEATEYARAALDKFSELRQPAGTGSTLRVLGVIALAKGNFDEAQESLDAALRIARQRTLRVLEAETLLALAALERKRGSGKDKFVQHQAEKIFNEIGALPWGVQVRRRMEEL